MKRIGTVRGAGRRIAVFVAIAAVSAVWSGYGREERSTGGDGDRSSIHLRIIAHSDSEADQVVKARVSAEVGRALQEWLDGRHSADAEEMRAALLPRLPELSRRIDGVLRRSRAPYSADVRWGVFPMPEKSDGFARYPAGRYEMLRIVLGDGRGSNFWCVLFPSLCFQKSKNCREERPANDAKKPKISWWTAEWVKKTFRRVGDVREDRGQPSEGLSGAWSEAAAKAARFFRSGYNGVGE